MRWSKRIGIPFDLPFRDYGTFKAHWKRNDCTNSYQKRRDMLNDLSGLLHDQLVEGVRMGYLSCIIQE